MIVHALVQCTIVKYICTIVHCTIEESTIVLKEDSKFVHLTIVYNYNV